MIARLFKWSAVLCAALAFAGQARADAVEDFYKGETVSIYAGIGAGGLYSNFAQLLARHMPKHMAGNPRFIVEHQPGAGGMIARVVLGDSAPRYDPLKWNWLGGWSEAVNTCSVWATVAKTIDDAKRKEVSVGAWDTGSTPYVIPFALNHLLGTKFKIVVGYSGAQEVRVAMERGEVDGLCVQYDGWKSARPQWLAEGRLAHLVQFGSKRDREMPDTPTMTELARTDEERQIMKFIEWGIEDRAMVVAPGVPPERLAALEKAYMATLRDPEFVAEAAKMQLEISPISGQQIRDFVQEIMALKPETVAKIKTAMGLK